METLSLNGEGLTASRIGLGTWAIGGWMWGGTDEAESVRTIQSAVERGITLIDTAAVYGFGRSEEIVGRALREGGLRQRTVLATKCAMDWDTEHRIARNASKRCVLKGADASLKRLRTDVIDLLQVHWPDPTVDVRTTAEAMAELKQAGKIRAIGVSNFSPAQMDAFSEVAAIDVAQNPYNLFECQIDNDVLPWVNAHHVRLLAYGALCRGLLSGKMRADRKFTGDDLRQSDPKFAQPRFGQYLAAVHALDEFARKNYNKTVLHLAIRWILDQYEGSVALWGARRPDQLDPVGDVSGWHLDADARSEIQRIIHENVTDPVGPEFMAPPSREPA